MKRLSFCLLTVVVLTACGERDPMLRTDDLPPGSRRIAAERAPTADEIAAACFTRDFGSCRDDPANTSYCEPAEGDLLVRAPVCARVAGDPAALDCRFGETTVPWGAPEIAYSRRRPGDFTPTAARFIRVSGRGGARWFAATYCR